MTHDLHAAAEHVAKHPHGRARYEAIFDTVHQQIAHDLASPHPLEAIKKTHAEYAQNKKAILDQISA